MYRQRVVTERLDHPYRVDGIYKKAAGVPLRVGSPVSQMPEICVYKSSKVSAAAAAP